MAVSTDPVKLRKRQIAEAANCGSGKLRKVTSSCHPLTWNGMDPIAPFDPTTFDSHVALRGLLTLSLFGSLATGTIVGVIASTNSKFSWMILWAIVGSVIAWITTSILGLVLLGMGWLLNTTLYKLVVNGVLVAASILFLSGWFAYPATPWAIAGAVIEWGLSALAVLLVHHRRADTWLMHEAPGGFWSIALLGMIFSSMCGAVAGAWVFRKIHPMR